MSKEQGFFVIHENKYIGPFERLNEAKAEARKIGSNIPIFHGILNKDKFEGKLVPKKKEDE
jgi:hypothetical protein